MKISLYYNATTGIRTYDLPHSMTMSKSLTLLPTRPLRWFITSSQCPTVCFLHLALWWCDNDDDDDDGNNDDGDDDDDDDDDNNIFK